MALISEAANDPMLGITAEMDGEIAAYGGVRTVHGRHFAFFNLVVESARKPFLLHRTVRDALAAALRSGVSPIYTPCDTSKYRAEAWLKRLGFRPVQDEERDEVIRAIEDITHNAIWIREA